MPQISAFLRASSPAEGIAVELAKEQPFRYVLSSHFFDARIVAEEGNNRDHRFLGWPVNTALPVAHTHPCITLIFSNLFLHQLSSRRRFLRCSPRFFGLIFAPPLSAQQWSDIRGRFVRISFWQMTCGGSSKGRLRPPILQRACSSLKYRD